MKTLIAIILVGTMSVPAFANGDIFAKALKNSFGIGISDKEAAKLGQVTLSQRMTNPTFAKSIIKSDEALPEFPVIDANALPKLIDHQHELLKLKQLRAKNGDFVGNSVIDVRFDDGSFFQVDILGRKSAEDSKETIRLAIRSDDEDLIYDLFGKFTSNHKGLSDVSPGEAVNHIDLSADIAANARNQNSVLDYIQASYKQFLQKNGIYEASKVQVQRTRQGIK